MGGAYVAKPEVVIVPDVPDGWGDWNFPGPWPPGYIPILTHSITAPTSILVEDVADVTVSLFDHAEYGTVEPVGSTIILTAKIGDTAIQLKYSEDESFADEIFASYSDLGDVWGSQKAIVFGIGPFDVGSTITLTAESIVFEDFEVAGSAEIEITIHVPVYALNLEAGDPGHVTPDEIECEVIAGLTEDGGGAENIAADSYILWTAVIDDEELIIIPDKSFITYIPELETYGATPDASFYWIEEEHIGKDVTVGAIAYIRKESDEEGQYQEVPAESPAIIPIVEPPYPTSLNASIQLNSWQWDEEGVAHPKFELKITRTPTTAIDWPSFGCDISVQGIELWWDNDSTYDGIPEIVCVANSGDRFITAVASALDKTKNYACIFFVREGGACAVNATVSATVTWSDNTIETRSVVVALAPYSTDKSIYLTVSPLNKLVSWGSGWT